MAGFVLLFLWWKLIIILILLLIYLLESFILYLMYKSSNHNCAWILQYNRVIIGELVDNKKMGYALFIFDLI